MNERWLYRLVAVIGFICFIAYIGGATAEPLQLNPTGCKFYAQDAGQIASTRDQGIIEELTQQAYAEKQYHESVKPHLINLIHYVYSSPLPPQQLAESLYAECIHNKGVIGTEQ